MVLFEVIASIVTIIIGIFTIWFLNKKPNKHMVGYVSGLRTHPVKSCKSVPLRSVNVTPLGLEHDRQFVLLNEHGTFMTLRKHPKFVLIRQSISERYIILEADGMAPLVLPLHMKQEDGDHCTNINVFRKPTFGVHVSDKADEWFSTYFGMNGCKLYCYPTDGTPRYSEDKGVKVKNYKNDKDGLMFGDGCPILILSNPSVHNINELISEDVTIDTFRPNIIVSKCSPFAEERWGLIDINGVRMQALYPCSRCVAVNVDPMTANVNTNILAEVKRVKVASEADVDNYPTLEDSPLVGMNYGVRRTGIIRIGDPIYAIGT